MEFLGDITGLDPNRPSLLELVAQEQLRDTLQPALKYILAVFAQQYPRYLIRIVNRFEECYSLLMFIVERHYLKVHGASFAENFYGMKRRRTPAVETVRVAVPYLRSKAHEYYEEFGGGVDPDIVEAEPQRASFTQASSRPWIKT
ncbi:ubiquitin-protein ligase peroxin 12 [Ceratobasidium sp. 414]|nr:ubiquitin-protein ligase peroxin 12 [Ceratobasidium sp. 414]